MKRLRAIGSIGLALAYVALLASTILTAGCAGLVAKLPHTPDGKVDVVLLLEWAQQGVDPACTSGDLNAKTCATVTKGLAAAKAAALHNPGEAAAQALAALDGLLANPDGSPAVPWLRWLKDVLLAVLNNQPAPAPAVVP